MSILNRDDFVLCQPRLMRGGVVLHTVVPAALIVCMVFFVSLIYRNGFLRLPCQRLSSSSSNSESYSSEKAQDSRHSLPQGPIKTAGRNLIRFGSSTSLTGACATTGTYLCEGIQAALAEANRNQSDDQYELVALDDIYSPLLAQANARKLLSDPSVMAFVGNLGTPTAITTASILSDSKITAFGFYTGASLLRQPMHASYMMHFRASYASEVDSIITGLVNEAGLSPKQIGLVTQRDLFGSDVFEATVRSMQKFASIEPTSIKHGQYIRGSLVNDHTVTEMLEQTEPIQAIIVAATDNAARHFIEHVRRRGFAGWMFVLSFASPEALRQELSPESRNRLVSIQCVPDPSADTPLAAKYRESLQQHDRHATPSYASLEGYILGRIITKAVVSADRPLTRETLRQCMLKLDEFELEPGFVVRLPMDRMRSKNTAQQPFLWLIEFTPEQTRPFQWQTLQQERQLSEWQP